MWSYSTKDLGRALIFLSPLLLASCGGGGGSGDSVPFKVKSILPVNARLNASFNLAVEVSFSRRVQPTSVVVPTTFSVTETAQPGSPLPGTFSFSGSGKVMTFTPSAPLLLATDYTITLAGGITDTSGKPLDLSKSLVPIPSVFQTQLGLDITAPIFAGATGASPLSDTQLIVNWSPATDDIDLPSAIVYNVYASTVSGAQNFAVPDVTSPPGATSQVLGGLLPFTAYFIVVRAEDSSGNEDLNLVEVSGTTMPLPDVIPPVFAGASTAVPISKTEVMLAWSMASDNQAPASQIVYNVYLSTVAGGQNFAAPTATTAPGALLHTVTGLNRDTDYFFVVRAEDPSGNEEGNTVELQARTFVSFSAQVRPVFSASCASIGCHAGAVPSQGLNLSSYAAISTTAINRPSVQAALDRIEPFQSASSYLIHKVDGTQLSVGGSGSRMPILGPALAPAVRDMIRAWIDEGALNN